MASADTLELKDGSLIDGRYMGGSQNSVRFQIEDELKTYSRNDILALTFSGMSGVAATPAPVAPPAPVAQPAPTPTAPAETRAPATLNVPANTRILVRTVEMLDSKVHGTGHMFTAKLEADLAVDNHVIASAGSKVYGRLIEGKKSGRMAGQARLTIELTDIMINNKPHGIATSGVKAVGERTGGKTARNVAVGAGVGALFRGSKGAKRGAAVGLGGSLLTEGSQVRIPAGTILEFTLRNEFVYAP
jgi:hypothetical protein